MNRFLQTWYQSRVLHQYCIVPRGFRLYNKTFENIRKKLISEKYNLSFFVCITRNMNRFLQTWYQSRVLHQYCIVPRGFRLYNKTFENIRKKLISEKYNLSFFVCITRNMNRFLQTWYQS